MKYEGEILYTSRYLRDIIGLPEEVCKSKCREICGRFRFADAKQALKEYLAEKSRRTAMWRKLQAEHRCVHRVGDTYCQKPAFMAGWPYCYEHLPSSAKARQNYKALRQAHRANGMCICVDKDGTLCENPVKPGRIRCEKHIQQLKDR
jgi:hypothetical protein